MRMYRVAACGLAVLLSGCGASSANRGSSAFSSEPEGALAAEAPPLGAPYYAAPPAYPGAPPYAQVGPFIGYAAAGPAFVPPPDPNAQVFVPAPPPQAALGAPSPPLLAPIGASPTPAPVADMRPRMGAVAQFAYIYRRPAKKGLALGYIRMGTSVPLLSITPVKGDGCKRGWFPVSPRGYACLDQKTTLDLSDPYYKALASVAPAPFATWPYRYAFSNGAPMYSRVPTLEEQARSERKFGARRSYVQLAEWSKGHEELLLDEPITATDPVPDIFADGKRLVGGGPRNPAKLVWREIPNGSMLAFAKAFEAQGRVWLLTPDLMLVPADRVRAIRRSTFHGVETVNGMDLPLAWNRKHEAIPKYRRSEGGSMVATTSVLTGKSAAPIQSDPVMDGDRRYYAVRGEPGVYIAGADVTIARARKEMPRGLSPDRKWIEVKIVPGTLTAYEGTRPVYSTIFSPGKGGVPVPGHDHTKYATTATGYFPIEWKDRVATMSNEKSEPKVLWFSDVPNIQYLRPPLAMHVAYWHEDFGNPKSAECVNVSPEDGRWLFNWTEPALPEGWGGIRPGDGNGRSTPVMITAK